MKQKNNDYNLFKEVSVTDPKYCKKVKAFGKPAFTNIDTYYLIEEATKHFGFYGKGFGLKNIEYEYIDIGTTKVCVLHSIFFFPDGEFPITNSDKFVYTSSKGNEIIDTDIYKKLETNTLAKALSKIGFGVDVFLGKFEDNNYVSEAFQAYELCNPQQQQELRKMLGYYGVDASMINKHFIISTLSELPANKYNEALALIKSIGENHRRSA